MAKKTLVVQFEGKSFTRTTARTYSHVILVSQKPEKVLASRIALMVDHMTRDYDYYRNNYNSGSLRPLSVLCGESDLSKVIEIRTDEIQANHYWQSEHGDFGLQAYAWSGRADLAEKAAAQCRKEYGDLAERVVIVPIN